MSDCQSWQQELDELLALGGSEADFQPELNEHLESCEDCREFCREGLLLNQMMEEPLPLPPAELVPGVMARITADRRPEEAKLPWAERLAWAASGAVGMFLLERLPEVSFSWFESLQEVLVQVDLTFPVPMAASASTLALAAVVLFAVQGTLVYRTRGFIS